MPSTSRTFGCGRDSTCVPRKWLASWISDAGAMISISGLAQAASGAAGGGTDQAFAARIGADRRRQHAGDGGHRAVEPELAEHREARERI